MSFKDLLFNSYESIITTDTIIQFIEKINENENFVSFFLLIILMNITFSIFFLPCSLFVLFFGAAYGGFLGGIFAYVSGMMSFAVTFFIGKVLKKTKFFNFIHERYLKKISFFSLQTKKLKWSHVILFFSNPVLPGASMGYFFGLCSFKTKSVFKKILLINFPDSILWAYMGSASFLVIKQNIENIYLTLIFFLICIIIFNKLYNSIKITILKKIDK